MRTALLEKIRVATENAKEYVNSVILALNSALSDCVGMCSAGHTYNSRGGEPGDTGERPSGADTDDINIGGMYR